ncbi:MAG TPA: HEPN domain-containing protein [Solirubrobacterales bacterium]|nr:HEPN domain-containing protein [Solirubrobacterales bacterium]
MPERDPKAEAAVLARKASDDATAMQLLAKNQEISDEIIGFHAQQAVEKWLKAVLGSRGVEFEYTHDLHRLIAEVTAAPRVVGRQGNAPSAGSSSSDPWSVALTPSSLLPGYP